MIVVGVVAQSPSTAPTSSQNALMAAPEVTTNPLDQLSSADIAAHVAKVAYLEEAPSVANNAISVNAQLSVTPADDRVVAKPQLVATAAKSVKDIKQHTVAEGETIAAIAQKYGVTSESIRWSNGLTGNTVAAGRNLTIPPVNGIVYTVKQGDTVDTLAVRYNANKDDIIRFNDAEVSGIQVGQRIVIPDGVQTPVRTANSSITGGGFAWGGFAPVYGANGYDRGYCTWWAAVRRAQIGRPVPSNLGNAATWKTLGSRAGMSISNSPSQHAVIWTPPRDYYGHVGFVESVNPDGSIEISEMNVAGWNRVSRKTLSAEQAAAYSYIQ